MTASYLAGLARRVPKHLMSPGMERERSIVSTGSSLAGQVCDNSFTYAPPRVRVERRMVRAGPRSAMSSQCSPRRQLVGMWVSYMRWSSARRSTGLA